MCIGEEFSEILGPNITFNTTLVSPNQPVYSLSSDTDISNKTKVSHPQIPGAQLVKVSNDTLSLEKVKSSVGMIDYPNGSAERSVITDDMIEKTDDYLIIISGDKVGMVIAYNSFSIDGLNISEPGIYITYYPSWFTKIGLILP